MLITVIKTDLLESEELFNKAYNLLPENRKKKIADKKFKSDKMRIMAAGLLLNQTVKMFVEKEQSKKERSKKEDFFKPEMTEISVKEAIKQYDRDYDYEIVYGENGKPDFKNKIVKFNLSHSGNYAVCVVDYNSVGIDIEGKRKNVLKVANRFFTKCEYEWICKNIETGKKIDEVKDLYDDNSNLEKCLTEVKNIEKEELYREKIQKLQEVRFLRIWTLKEAYSKVTGIGIANGVGKVSFEINSDIISFSDNFNRSRYDIMQYFIEDYVIGVIVEKI